ncbi:MAG: hypothetical protein ABIZ80_13470, partial [Bryobacteraceae bacterium]
NDFSPVAEWVAARKREGTSCTVEGFVSAAARIAAAARDKKLDISGTLFLTTGEALTAAKRALIESTGAEAFSYYHIHEIGPIGQGCRKMTEGNSVHFFKDALAAITYRRTAPLSGVDVNSILFTQLLPIGPRVLINAEMDDGGVIEPFQCDCTYAAAGFHLRIRDIASYGKMTGQGITLVGTDLIRILEESLPVRFGGAAGDYQLVEADEGSGTKILLHMSPRTKQSKSWEVREYFLAEVRKLYGGSLAVRVWNHSEGVEVVRAEPYRTPAGKVLPLHLLGSKS